MTVRVRKQIYIEPEQEAMLKRLAGETGMPEAEIIRQAIDRHAQSLRVPRRDLRAWAREREFIARLIEQGAVPGGRNWRREDLYER